MLDMKKKVAAMLDFISRTQLEMAGDMLSVAGSEATEKMMRNLAGTIMPMLQENNGDGAKEVTNTENGAVDENRDAGKKFKDLSLLEMMDELTRQLVKWQNQFT